MKSKWILIRFVCCCYLKAGWKRTSRCYMLLCVPHWSDLWRYGRLDQLEVWQVPSLLLSSFNARRLLELNFWHQLASEVNTSPQRVQTFPGFDQLARWFRTDSRFKRRRRVTGTRRTAPSAGFHFHISVSRRKLWQADPQRAPFPPQRSFTFDVFQLFGKRWQVKTCLHRCLRALMWRSLATPPSLALYLGRNWLEETGKKKNTDVTLIKCISVAKIEQLQANKQKKA